MTLAEPDAIFYETAAVVGWRTPGTLMRRWCMPKPRQHQFHDDHRRRGRTARAFARARHVTKLTVRNSRVTAVSMEPRGCLSEYDPGTRRYTLYTSTQNVHGVRAALASEVFHIPLNRIRVIARDVGGGFGMKGHTYPEEAVITWAARHVGRPVKWIPSRTEALLTDFHGRDQTVDAELALDADGRFLAYAGPARTMPDRTSPPLAPCRSWVP